MRCVAFALTLLARYAWALRSSNQSAPTLASLRRRDNPDSEEFEPTAQPMTRGQDAQECGVVDLSQNLFLKAKHADEFYKSGTISSADGAVWITWTQNLFSWQPETVDFFTGSGAKLVARAEVVDPSRAATITNRRRRTSLWSKITNPDPVKDETTITLKDCEGDLMYVIREQKFPPYLMTIANKDDDIVARTTAGQLASSQVHWNDQDDKAIAISQSPAVMSVKISRDEAAKQYDTSVGGVQAWQLLFLEGYGAKSTLQMEQNRWVIAFAAQEHAIRMGMRATQDAGKPLGFYVVVGLSLLMLAACVAGALYGLMLVVQLIYPPHYPEIENKFLQGSLASRLYGTSAP